MTFASLTFKRTRMITTSAGVTTSGVRFPLLSSLSSETQQKVFLSFPRGRSSIGGDARRLGGWSSSSSYSSRRARSLSGSHLLLIINLLGFGHELPPVIRRGLGARRSTPRTQISNGEISPDARSDRERVARFFKIFHALLTNREERGRFISPRQRIRGKSAHAETDARGSEDDWVSYERSSRTGTPRNSYRRTRRSEGSNT